MATHSSILAWEILYGQRSLVGYSPWGHKELYTTFTFMVLGFLGSSDGKEYACNVGDPGSLPGSGRSSAEGNGYPLQYSCLENPMDRGAWWAAVCGVVKSQT